MQIKLIALPLLITLLFHLGQRPAYAEQAPVYDIDLPDNEESASSSPANVEQPLRDHAEEALTPPSIMPQNNIVVVAKRLIKLEQKINNLHVEDAWVRLEALQNELQSLRGQIESLSHQLVQLGDQQKAVEANINNKLLEQAAAMKAYMSVHPREKSTTVMKASPSNREPETNDDTEEEGDELEEANNQPNRLEEQKIYQTAYNLIKEKKYNLAAQSLQGMLQKYPAGQFASNAHYWLGELYSLMNNHPLALVEFNTIIKDYPNSPRLSDAQLKVGLLYAAQSNWASAKASFKKVINHYPGTAAARIAADQLKQIEQH